MIKLITPKRDLYLDGATSNPEALFGKKGKFYEVKGFGYEGEDIMFVDERSVEHSYGLDFVDTDFWTVDFDKGFDFKTSLEESYSFKNNYLVGTDTHYNNYMEGIAIGVIKQGGWVITRFSNQTVIPTPTEEPSHPYENWKKDIGIAKFQRCIDKVNLLHYRVEGIKGLLDRKNELFYYSVHGLEESSYISCKVILDEDNYEWKFPRPNKDTPATSNIVKDEHAPIRDWLVNELGRVDLDSYTSTVKQECGEVDKILASFKLPEFAEESFNPEYQFKSDNQIVTDNIAKREYIDRQMELAYKNTPKSSVTGCEEVSEEQGGVCTSEQGIASDGGKSEYYKVVLPQWLLDRQQEEGCIMLEDLAEVMYGNDFNFVNVFKAQKRMFEMQQGKGKKGNTLEYDATKCKYYVDKQVEVFNR